MGLILKRWHCAGGWLSRLDMNTCQTSIKPVCYRFTSVILILGTKGTVHHNSGSATELNEGAKVKRTNKPSKYVSYNETTETIIASYWLKKSTNLSAF